MLVDAEPAAITREVWTDVARALPMRCRISRGLPTSPDESSGSSTVLGPSSVLTLDVQVGELLANDTEGEDLKRAQVEIESSIRDHHRAEVCGWLFMQIAYR